MNVATVELKKSKLMTECVLFYNLQLLLNIGTHCYYTDFE